MSVSPVLDDFLAVLADSIQQQTFIKCVLSKYRGQEPALQRISIRSVSLRNEPMLTLVYSYQTNDVTKNLPINEGLTQISEWLTKDFKGANLFTSTQELQLAISKKGKALLHRSNLSTSAVTPPSVSHNREKQRFLTLDRPFLVDLGVTDTQHQLIPAMSRKWKQINKFIEIFHHAFESLALTQEQKVTVVDFGSGKGYLTFAIHDFLHNQLGYQTQVTGVELRDNLVQLCMTAVKRLELNGLDFYQGDVRSYTPPALDVMIALHACDIATDYAIHTGIRLGASIIMCAPCCHKQIRPQLQSPQILKPLLQHGIHLGQQAEMLTDGLRALWLEACGYDTQVFEFVALEHTSKNKMIMAVKRGHTANKQQVLANIDELKKFYGIQEHCLEVLLAEGGFL